MYFNVSGLLRGNVGAQQLFHFADEELRYEGTRFHDVEARGRLTRTDRTVLVEADVKAVCEVECARCLTDSEVSLSLEFAEEFVPENMDLVARRARSGVWDDDEALWIDDSNTLDLSVPLWQTLSAGLPLMHVCREDCLGICVDCYADLNKESCRCDTIDRSERDAAASAADVRVC